jgi:hypothetical protein
MFYFLFSSRKEQAMCDGLTARKRRIVIQRHSSIHQQPEMRARQKRHAVALVQALFCDGPEAKPKRWTSFQNFYF